MVDYFLGTFSGITWLAASPNLSFVLAVTMAGLPIFLFMALNALIAVYAERKISAFMQDRLGPMGQGVGLHAGKWGILQTAADAVKLITKEDIIPATADKKLFIIAPFILFTASFTAFAAFPFNEYLVAAAFNIGLFYILAMGSVGVIAIEKLHHVLAMIHRWRSVYCLRTLKQQSLSTAKTVWIRWVQQEMVTVWRYAFCCADCQL